MPLQSNRMTGDFRSKVILVRRTLLAHRFKRLAPKPSVSQPYVRTSHRFARRNSVSRFTVLSRTTPPTTMFPLHGRSVKRPLGGKFTKRRTLSTSTKRSHALKPTNQLNTNGSPHWCSFFPCHDARQTGMRPGVDSIQPQPFLEAKAMLMPLLAHNVRWTAYRARTLHHLLTNLTIPDVKNFRSKYFLSGFTPSMLAFASLLA